MKKTVALVLSIVFCLLMFCVCGRKTDQDGNTLITSDWTYVSFTVNGTQTKVDDIPFYMRIFTNKDDPKFKCDDAGNFTITILQKERTGTLTVSDDGTYVLTGQNGSSLYAKIEGNTLTVYDDQGKMEIVFETS